jgi:hypothetical protein
MTWLGKNRNVKTDKVQWDRSSDALREKSVEIMYQGLATNTDAGKSIVKIFVYCCTRLDSDLVVERARQIERKCYMLHANGQSSMSIVYIIIIFTTQKINKLFYSK